MAVLYSADFVGADTDPIGGNYSTITGLTSCQRLSNALAGSSSGDCGVYVNSITTPNDCYCETTVPPGNTPPDEGGSICRVDEVNNNFYLAMWVGTGGGSEVHLYRWNNGTKTLLDNQPFSPGAPFKLRISALGSLIRAYVNGALKCTATDGNFATGKAGFFITRGADPTIFTASTIEIGDLIVHSGTIYSNFKTSHRPAPFMPGNAR